MRYGIRCNTKIGQLQIVQEDDAIVELGFGGDAREICWQETALLAEAKKQLEEYLEGSRQYFDVKICAGGTVFQEKIWQALREIPYGETRTYGEIAIAAGSPKGARAVGMACNRNPIMIMIPCHRVIGKSGSLTGFAGGLSVKEKLLKLEEK